MVTESDISMEMEDSSLSLSDGDAQSLITINIDNSVDILGDDNVVLLPCGADHSIAALLPSIEIDDGKKSSSPSLTSPKQSTQGANLADAIFAVVDNTGAFNDEVGNLRPIVISVASGVRLRGSRNTVSAKVVPLPRSVHSQKSTGPILKRRACSVCHHQTFDFLEQFLTYH